MWVAGGFGTMAGWDGAWRCPEEPLTQQHLHAVVVWDGAPYWFGGDLLRPGGNHFTIATRGGAAISGFSVCR